MEKNQNQGPSKCPYSKFSNFLKKYTKPIPHFSDDTNIRKRETMKLLDNTTGSNKVSLEKGIFYHHYQKCFDDYYTFFYNNHKELLEDISSRKYVYGDFDATKLRSYANKIRIEISNFFMDEGKIWHDHITNGNGDPQIKARLEEFSSLKEFSDRKKTQSEEDNLYKGYAHGIDTIVGLIIYTIINLKNQKSSQDTINYNQLKKISVQNSSEPGMSSIILHLLSHPTLFGILGIKENIHTNDGGYNSKFLDAQIDNYHNLVDFSIDDDRSQGADSYGCPMRADFHAIIPIIIHLIYLQLERLTSSSTT